MFLKQLTMKGFKSFADDTVLDWVLRMARVPDGDFLDRIAERGGLTPDLLDAIADGVAAYHQALPPVAAPRDAMQIGRAHV